MQVTVEDISTVKKILHVEVSEKDLTTELNKSYNELKKTANIKGFRKGKIPRSVLEKMFGKNVNETVRTQIVTDSYQNAVQETGLIPIGEPNVDLPEIENGKPFKYSVTIDIKPEIEKIEFEGLELTKQIYTVSEEEINLQLKAHQKNMAGSKELEETRPAQLDDIAVIDLEGFKDGKPFEMTPKSKDINITLGANKFIPEIEQALVGMNPGESKNVQVKFPENVTNQALANVEVEYRFTLKELKEQVLPPIDDDFAKKLGNFDSVDVLKEEIRKDLQRRYDKRSEMEVSEQVYNLILEKVNFEVPDTWVQYELESLLMEIEQNLAYQNLTMEQAGYTREGLIESYSDAAEAQARRHLLLDKIIEQENISLDPEEIEAGFRDAAYTMGQTEDWVKDLYQKEENKEKLEAFKFALLEKKALKIILDKSNVTEKKV